MADRVRLLKLLEQHGVIGADRRQLVFKEIWNAAVEESAREIDSFILRSITANPSVGFIKRAIAHRIRAGVAITEGA